MEFYAQIKSVAGGRLLDTNSKKCMYFGRGAWMRPPSHTYSYRCRCLYAELRCNSRLPPRLQRIEQNPSIEINRALPVAIAKVLSYPNVNINRDLFIARYARNELLSRLKRCAISQVLVLIAILITYGNFWSKNRKFLRNIL